MFPFTKIKAQQLEDLPIDATGLAVQSHLNFAGGKNVQADQLATVEACVGLYARCFARAQVSGDAARFFDPPTLQGVVRAALLSGNAVAEIDDGILSLASTWNVAGKSMAALIYELTIAHPSGSTMIRKLPSSEVLHVRLNVDNKNQWRGRGALERARATVELAGVLERSAIKEAKIPVARILPWAGRAHPDQMKQILELFEHFRSTESGLFILPSGSGADGTARPSSEAIHPAPSESHLKLRESVNHELAAAFGVPVPILFPVGDGQARRAAMSAFIEGSLIPMARVIEAEAVAKAGRRENRPERALWCR